MGFTVYSVIIMNSPELDQDERVFLYIPTLEEAEKKREELLKIYPDKTIVINEDRMM